MDSYQKAIAILNSFYSKDLSREDIGTFAVKSFLEYLDNPQDNYKIIHITGTSGKTSVAYLLSNSLIKLNYNVGLSVSPFVVNIRERIQLNNKFISKEEFSKIVFIVNNKYKDYVKSGGISITYFEFITVLAFYYFKQKKIDFLVLEVGLGGEKDATNVVNSTVSVITSIGLDHTHILGDTKEEILKDKMKIVKKNSVCFTGIGDDLLLNILGKFCEKQKTDLIVVNTKKKINLHIPLYYQWNINLVYSILQYLYKEEKIGNRMEKKEIFTQVSGRFEKITYQNKKIVLDGAHNPQKLRALKQSYLKLNKIKPVCLVSFKNNKDIKNNLEIINSFSDIIIYTEYILSDKFKSFGSFKIENFQNLFLSKYIEKFIQNPNEALEYIISNIDEEIPILVTGSLYLVSNIRQIVYK